MDSNPSQSSQTSKTPQTTKPDRDFLTHLEAYLSKRDGVDKLLKISRYVTKLIIATSLVSDSTRLKSFESSVGLSRKAFRLGKFVQDVNSLRNAHFHSHDDVLLNLIAYGGEGIYYFVEQFVWLGKSGLIDKRHLKGLQKVSAWAEFVGYFGSIALKLRELRVISQNEKCLESTVEVALKRGDKCDDEVVKLRKLKEKKLLKRLSVVQDFADALMAWADIREGKGRLSAPMLLSSAGLLSALISTHKNWLSC